MVGGEKLIFQCGGITETVSDGIGMALEIFFQGCHKRCLKCHNPDLQEFDKGIEIDTSDIVSKIYHSVYESLVLCGGEPLDQPYATLELLDTMCKLGIPTVLYTGYEYVELDENVKKLATVIISGQYEHRKRTGKFPASYNQEIHFRGKIYETTPNVFRDIRQAL